MSTLHARRLLAGLVVVIALVAAACSNTVPYAAIVNGHTITTADVTDELEEIAANEAYVAAIESNGVTVLGVAEGTFNTGFVAQVLTRQIAFSLVEAELEDLDLEVSETDVAAASLAVESQVGGAEVFGGFSDGYKQSLAFRTAQITVLQEALATTPTGPDAARAFFEENKDSFAEACAHHILYGIDPSSVDPDAARADALSQAEEGLARLEGGADFEATAIAESTDTGSGSQGGDLGCAPRGVYVAEFEDAIFTGEIGEILGPVETQFGYHLIRVDSRDEPEFEDVEERVNQQLAGQSQQAFSDWITSAFEEADVTVDARYGTWGGGFQPSVLPPDSPQRPVAPVDDGLLDQIPIEP